MKETWGEDRLRCLPTKQLQCSSGNKEAPRGCRFARGAERLPLSCILSPWPFSLAKRGQRRRRSQHGERGHQAGSGSCLPWAQQKPAGLKGDAPQPACLRGSGNFHGDGAAAAQGSGATPAHDKC